MTSAETSPEFDARLQQRLASKPATNGSAKASLETIPVQSVHNPHGNIPNTPLASSLIAFILGSVFTLGSVLTLIGGLEESWWATWQLGFFVAAWAAFHWAEFAVTAGWNRDKCSVDSYLLDNGAMYHIAHSTALVEFFITMYFKPGFKTYRYVSEVGVALVITGQALRSLAMIHASKNFSHAVMLKKLPDHQLVTDGIYAWLRHPSYTGFFYWALGTQLVLQNPASFVLFFVLLWRFFFYRIRGEEFALVRFFPEYEAYRKRVGTLIPFIR